MSNSAGVAFYARVSSDQQAKENTIASQVQALRQRIQTDSFAVPPHLAFQDDGYSGTTLLRPALEALRDQAAAGVIEKLYVHSPDRLARKYAYQVLLLDEFRRAGVEVVFLNHAIGTSPEGDLLLQVQGMISEYERAKILERSRRGRLHAARRGSINVLHSAPYGYRYLDRHQGAGEGTLVVHEEEAGVVRRIFAWAAEERCTIGAICRRLQDEGIASPKGKPLWSRSSVASLLRNSTYRGTAYYGKSRSGEPRPRLRPAKGQPAHPRRRESRYATAAEERIAIATPALVDAAQFAAVAEQMRENRQRHRLGQRGARYLLQGLVVCAGCGHAFYGKPVTSVYKGRRSYYTYYRCVGCEPYRHGGERLCTNRQVRTDRLEAVVWEDIEDLLKDPKRIEKETQRRHGSTRSRGAAPGKAAEQLRQAKAGLSRILDAYENGMIEREAFTQRATRLKARVQELTAQVEAATQEEKDNQRVDDVLAEFQKFADAVRDGLSQADWQTKRAILRALVKRIEIDVDEVRVIYRIPPQACAENIQAGSSLQESAGNPHSGAPTK